MDNHSEERVYDAFPDESQVLNFQNFSSVETMQQQSVYNQHPPIFTPTTSATFGDIDASSNKMGGQVTEFDEPPLLEELEIYPDRILEKSLAVLNPLQSPDCLIERSEYLLKEPDLAGPIAFCLTLAACLSISNSKAQFGYIYGLSTISVLVMFCLIWLMCNSLETHVTVSAVASVLGYSMLPIVGLSILDVFVTLNNFYGLVFAGAAIFIATMSSSRMFCMMTADPHQRYLIAYPCALLYALFSMLVLF
uniref:Protein YIPF n=1 Tax=Anopheles atroparvus TaxID=41427 RepID=A0AAG5DN73_ANOAO